MNGSLSRFFGGSPARVIAQLIVVSVVVGIVLTTLGLSPFDIVSSIERLVRRVWDTGFDAIVWTWRYFLLGAVVVVPIWLLVRVVKVGRRPAGP